MSMKEAKLSDILTEDEMKQAMRAYAEARPGTFAKWCDETLIRPNIERINKKLGQENDPRYLAYLVEYALTLS